MPETGQAAPCGVLGERTVRVVISRCKADHRKLAVSASALALAFAACPVAAADSAAEHAPSANGSAIIIMPGFDQAQGSGPQMAMAVPILAPAVGIVADDPAGDLVSGGDGPTTIAAPTETGKSRKSKKRARKQAMEAPLAQAVVAPASHAATASSTVEWLPGLKAPSPAPAAQVEEATASAPLAMQKVEAEPARPRAGKSRNKKAPRLSLSRGSIRAVAGLDELAEPAAAVVASAELPEAASAATASPEPASQQLASLETASLAPAPQVQQELAVAVSPPIQPQAASSIDPVWSQPSDGSDSIMPAATEAPQAAEPPPVQIAMAQEQKLPAPKPSTSLNYPWAPPPAATPAPAPTPIIETPAVDPEKLAKIDASPEVRAATLAVAAAPNLAVEFLPSSANTESLRDAIIAALKGNPEIQIALARQDFARYGVHQANAALLPKVDLNMAIGGELNTPNAGDPTRLVRKEGSVTLNQNVFDFGATFNDIKRARADYRSAQWGTRERIETIAYEITTAYLTVLQQQKLVALTQEKIVSADKILKMVTIQNGLGLNTTADVSRAKARVENVQAELLDRQSGLQQAREAYRRLTRRLPMNAIDQPSPGDALPATAEMAVDMIDTRNPRLAQAMEDRRSLDRQRAAQTGNFFPKFALTAQGNWKDDVAGATGVNKDARAMVTMTYNFLNGGAEIAIRKRIEAKLRESEYEIDRRRREVEQDIRIDFTALEAARAKIATINNEIAAAQKVDELYRQQFREGRRSVFDLLDSQQILFDAKASQIANGTAKQLAEFRVLQRLGGLFELVSQGEPLPDITTRAPGMAR
jgi:TolC family type I secretion outer membrane protein